MVRSFGLVDPRTCGPWQLRGSRLRLAAQCRAVFGVDDRRQSGREDLVQQARRMQPVEREERAELEQYVI